MKAMILAAGMGSRLGAVTQSVPKPLMPVGDKVLLDLVVERLKEAAVNSIMINLHHLGEQIEAHVKSKNSYGIEIQFSKEEKLLGTGGGLKKAQHFFKDESSFLLYNSDVYCELDLSLLQSFHQEKGACASLVCLERQSARSLMFDSEGQLAGWSAGKDGEMIISDRAVLDSYGFSGIHAISPRIFEYMKDETESFSIINTYINAAKAGERVLCFPIKDIYWIDAGKPETLEELRCKLNSAT